MADELIRLKGGVQRWRAKKRKAKKQLAVDGEPCGEMRIRGMILSRVKGLEPLFKFMNEFFDEVLKWKISFYTGTTNMPTYDFLRDDPRFQEILAKHKEVYDENLRKYGDLIDLIKE